MSVVLYESAARNWGEQTSYVTNLDGLYTSWRRTNRAIGGYHIGKLTIHDLGMPQLTNYFETWLGYRIVESICGLVTWEGLVWQLDLFKNGVNYRRTLDRDKTHNSVKVYYTDTSGDQQTVAWSENESASEIFGTIEMVYTIGVTGSTTATAFRDNKLTKHAWPISRQVGSTTVGTPTQQSDGLYITCAGYWTTLDWEYYESSTSGAGHGVIQNLLNNSYFVTWDHLEPNSGLSDAEADGTSIPKTNRDFIEDIINAGDNSGNVWTGGVYAGRKFRYEPAPTTVEYTLRNGWLYDNVGFPVIPETLEAGFYVRDSNAPIGYQPAGTSNVWDDPQVSWVEEVEFEWPNILRLNFPGEPLGVDQIWSQEIIRETFTSSPSGSYTRPSGGTYSGGGTPYEPYIPMPRPYPDTDWETSPYPPGGEVPFEPYIPMPRPYPDGGEMAHLPPPPPDPVPGGAIEYLPPPYPDPVPAGDTEYLPPPYPEPEEEPTWTETEKPPSTRSATSETWTR